MVIRNYKYLLILQSQNFMVTGNRLSVLDRSKWKTIDNNQFSELHLLYMFRFLPIFKKSINLFQVLDIYILNTYYSKCMHIIIMFDLDRYIIYITILYNNYFWPLILEYTLLEYILKSMLLTLILFIDV